jgi:hypothetical protein
MILIPYKSAGGQTNTGSASQAMLRTLWGVAEKIQMRLYVRERNDSANKHD